MPGFNLFRGKAKDTEPEEATPNQVMQVQEPKPQEVKQSKETKSKKGKEPKQPKEAKPEKEKDAKVNKFTKGKGVARARPAKYDPEALYQRNAQNYERASWYLNNYEAFKSQIRTGYSSAANPDSPLGRGEAVSSVTKAEQEMKAQQEMEAQEAANTAASPSGSGRNEYNDVDAILPTPPLSGGHSLDGRVLSNAELLGHSTVMKNLDAGKKHHNDSVIGEGSQSLGNGKHQALSTSKSLSLRPKDGQSQGKGGSKGLGGDDSRAFTLGETQSSQAADRTPQYLGPANFYPQDQSGLQYGIEPAMRNIRPRNLAEDLEIKKIKAGSKASARIKGEGLNLSNWYLNEEAVADLENAKESIPRFLYRASIIPDHAPDSCLIFGEGVADIAAVNVKDAKVMLTKAADNPLTDTTFATWSCSLIFAFICAWRATSAGTNAKHIFICMLDTASTTCVKIFPTQVLLFDFGVYGEDHMDTLRLRHTGEFLVTEKQAGNAEVEIIPYRKLLRLGLVKRLLPEIMEGKSLACPRAQLRCVRRKTFDGERKSAIDDREAKAALAIAKMVEDKNMMPFLTALLTMRARSEQDERFMEYAIKLPGGADYPRYYLYRDANKAPPAGMPETEEFAAMSCVLLEQIADTMISALPTHRVRRFLSARGFVFTE